MTTPRIPVPDDVLDYVIAEDHDPVAISIAAELRDARREKAARGEVPPLAGYDRLVAERDAARALLELVAGNLANFVAKREDAPAAADAHLREAMEALVAYQPKDGYGEAAKALRLDLWREGPMRSLQDERDAARAELAAVKRQRDELLAAADQVADALRDVAGAGHLAYLDAFDAAAAACAAEQPKPQQPEGGA